MSREQRVASNFGLHLAQTLANKKSQRLFVVFTLSDSFLGAGLRQYSFMFDGLKEVEKSLRELNIPFVMLVGEPSAKLVDFCTNNDVDSVTMDFDPLKIKQQWQSDFIDRFDGNIYEVDGHNIVPCRVASQKQEFGAYTIRPKISRVLEYFLAQSANISLHKFNIKSDFTHNNFDEALKRLRCDDSVGAIDWLKSGEASATQQLLEFVNHKLDGYMKNRNDPNKNGTSSLSPFLHFGQIYAGDIAKAVINSSAPSEDKEAFLEELIIRKELSDNFCFYNPNYDNFDGFPNWAKTTLYEHETDSRDFIYSVAEFENAQTHDDLWNAAQKELLISGKIHGYMRMYWAKKLLEWTPNPKIAIEVAIYLNDKYALDGRDANGYAGIAWSIGGVHDRAWFGRSVFGKIRYMNANGAKNKFDTKSYAKKWLF